mgnify:CR=1 FL=1
MKVLLIIPAYNEEENILNTCRKIEEYSKDIDYIVINDGSKDNTEKILQENNIKHIKLIKNLGIGGAVQTGYKYAYYNDYDIAVQFDGDGQHDINYLPTICEPIVSGQANMCIGTRYLDKRSSEFQSTFMRRLGKNIISFFIMLFCHKKITDPTSGFRAIDKNIIKVFANDYPTEYPEPESTVEVLVDNFKVVEKSVSMNERIGGKSSINVWKSIDYMIKVSLAVIIDSIHFRKGNRVEK